MSDKTIAEGVALNPCKCGRHPSFTRSDADGYTTGTIKCEPCGVSETQCSEAWFGIGFLLFEWNSRTAEA